MTKTIKTFCAVATLCALTLVFTIPRFLGRALLRNSKFARYPAARIWSAVATR